MRFAVGLFLSINDKLMLVATNVQSLVSIVGKKPSAGGCKLSTANRDAVLGRFEGKSLATDRRCSTIEGDIAIQLQDIFCRSNVKVVESIT